MQCYLTTLMQVRFKYPKYGAEVDDYSLMSFYSQGPIDGIGHRRGCLVH